jgi:hypothetical protein
MPAKTRLAQLIAREEGFGIAATIPTRDHNPGDLEHAPHLVGWDGKIGIEPDDDAGWADLERQLELYAGRNMTLRQMISIYAPPSENETQRYLDFVCNALGLSPDESVADALAIPASVP